MSEIMRSMDRRDESTVRKTTRALWSERLIEEVGGQRYTLTQRGFSAAVAIATELTLR